MQGKFQVPIKPALKISITFFRRKNFSLFDFVSKKKVFFQCKFFLSKIVDKARMTRPKVYNMSYHSHCTISAINNKAILNKMILIHTEYVSSYKILYIYMTTYIQNSLYHSFIHYYTLSHRHYSSTYYYLF